MSNEPMSRSHFSVVAYMQGGLMSCYRIARKQMDHANTEPKAYLRAFHLQLAREYQEIGRVKSRAVRLLMGLDD